jgi:hypothetical protein
VVPAVHATTPVRESMVIPAGTGAGVVIAKRAVAAPPRSRAGAPLLPAVPAVAVMAGSGKTRFVGAFAFTVSVSGAVVVPPAVVAVMVSA